MEITVQELTAKVLKNLDENGENQINSTTGVFESVSISDLIADSIGSVAEEVINGAEWKDIDEWKELSGEVDWIDPGHGEMPLPSDFLRLMCFRMSDWKKSVTTATDLNSATYALRFNSAPGRRSIRKSPMVAISGGTTRKSLEFIGSMEPGAYLQRGGYLPRPQSDESDMLWIPRSLLGRIVDALASKVRSILE